MRYSSRFFLYAPITLFVFIAMAASLHWWLAAQAFSRRLDTLNGHALMPGVTWHYSSKKMSGFPFRLDAVFEDFQITVAATHGPVAWTSEKFAMHGLIDTYEREIFEAAGWQTLSWNDRNGKRHVLHFLPASLHASSLSDKNGLARFDFEIVGAGGTDFTLAKMQFHLRRRPAGRALDYMASMDGLKLAHPTRYGETLNRLRLVGTLAPISSLSGLLKGEMRWQDAAKGWSAAHGRLQVTSGELRWNKADMTVNGAFSLDADKKPVGDLRVIVNGVTLPAPLGTSPIY